MRVLWLASLSILFTGACSGGGDDDATEEGDDDDDDDDDDAGDDDDDDDDTGDDDDDDDDTTIELPPVPLLADGDASAVEIVDVATVKDGLSMPSDIAFHPKQDTAWITNRDDDSMVVLKDAGTDEQTSDYYWSANGSNHFLAKPAALAFGESGDFATIHEEDELTQGIGGTPVDFMGPTLWTGAQFQFDGGHSSHLDMLHNSPNGVGIAWVEGNAYYVFDGWNDSITFYDFHEDHDLGGSDHSDGEILRCVEGEVSYVEGVGSHLVYDDDNKMPYIADTGNNRIAVLDTTSGTLGGVLSPNYDGLGPGKFNYIDDAELTTLIDGADHGLELPSGLEIHDDIIYVGDNATSMIHAFTLDGHYITGLDLGLDAGALQGFAIFDDAIWFTNEKDHTVSVIRAN